MKSFASAGIVLLSLSIAAQPTSALSTSASFKKVQTKISGSTSSVAAGQFRSGISYDDVVYVADHQVYYLQSSGGSETLGQPVQLASFNSLANAKNIDYVLTADFNNDGFEDLLVLTNQLEYYVALASPSASPPFLNPSTYSIAAPAGNWQGNIGVAAVGDMNNDGYLDIVLGLASSTSQTTGGENPTTTFTYTGYYAIVLNNKTGGFPSPTTAAATNASSSGENAASAIDAFDPRLALGDFNADSYLDVAFAFHTSVEWLTQLPTEVVLGNGTSTLDFSNLLTTPSSYAGAQDVKSVLPNNPGVIPAGGMAAWLAIAFNDSSHVRLYPAQGSGSTTVIDNKLGSTPRGPMGPPNDYNNDGVTDLLYLDGNSSKVAVGYNWAADSKDYHSYGMDLGTDILTGDYGDINGDGLPDVVGAEGSDINVYYNTSGN